MADSESNIRNCWSCEPVVGLCKSRDSYCCLSRPTIAVKAFAESNNRCRATTVPDTGQGFNHQLYYYYILLYRLCGIYALCASVFWPSMS